MQKQFGVRLDEAPKGFKGRVVFPRLASMDKWTHDGRFLKGDGGDVINLPADISFLDHESEFGHLDAVMAGRLDVVTFHEDGNISGEGWAIDDEVGQKMARYIDIGVATRNSVDLRNVDMRIKFPSFEEIEDFFDKTDEDGFSGPMPKVLRRFDQWKIAGTTVVRMPAFEEADKVKMDEWEMPEVITASFVEWTAEVQFDAEEVTAAGGSEMLAPWKDFHIEEGDDPAGTPLTVDEDGRVFGHLGLWNSCHAGFVDRCVRIQPSRTGYGSFCSASVLTDNGLVRTGPLFLYSGHPEQRRPRDIAKAYGGTENAWADVRISNGKFGPWISGRVRPGVADERVYAARASKISGHWLNGELVAAVSVNVPGYDVPYQFSQDGTDEYLVACFATADCGCEDDNPFAQLAAALAAIED